MIEELYKTYLHTFEIFQRDSTKLNTCDEKFRK